MVGFGCGSGRNLRRRQEGGRPGPPPGEIKRQVAAGWGRGLGRSHESLCPGDRERLKHGGQGRARQAECPGGRIRAGKEGEGGTNRQPCPQV